MNELTSPPLVNENLKSLLSRSINATPLSVGNSDSAVFEIDNPDPFYSQFLIRTTGNINDVRSYLKNSSCLKPPQLSFHGFKASQPLLALRNPFLGHTILEIIPRHEGASLCVALQQNSAIVRNEILQLDNPQAMFEELFEQVAFLKGQPYSHIQLDPSTHNLMFNKGEISLIDIVRSNGKLATPSAERIPELQKHAVSLISHTILRALKDTLPSDNTSYDTHINTQINSLEEYIEKAQEAINQKIESQSVGESHTQWKGFATVDSVKALSLDTTPHALKATLDALYTQAVPGR